MTVKQIRNAIMLIQILKNRFLKYLEEKTINPLLVEVKNPINSIIETFYLKGKDLITVFTSASTGSVSNIPFEINKLLNNDLTSVKERLKYVFQEPGEGIGKGMRLSVWCAEENPFNSQEKITMETNKYLAIKGLSSAVFDNEVCNIWNVKKVSKIENKAIKNDIPILFISGEYDSETPIKWAESMANNMTNSFYLVFKGWKHGPTTNWNNQCAMHAANDFFNNPSNKPNPECFAEIQSPIFKIGDK